VTIRRARRAVQILTLGMIVLIPILNRAEITFLSGTFYSLAIGPVWITDPIIGFQTMLTSLRIDKALLLSMVIPLAAAAVLGRVFCSWMCPQNTLSEWVDHLADRLSSKRMFTFRTPRHVRTAVTAAVVLAAPLAGFPLASLLSAPGIISAQTARLIKEGAVGAEVILIAVILIAELFVARRVWCSTLCPVGGFLALFRFRRTMRVALVEDAQHHCGRCHACDEACQLGLAPMAGDIQPVCHNCGDCIDTCARLQHGARPLVFKR